MENFFTFNIWAVMSFELKSLFVVSFILYFVTFWLYESYERKIKEKSKIQEKGGSLTAKEEKSLKRIKSSYRFSSILLLLIFVGMLALIPFSVEKGQLCVYWYVLNLGLFSYLYLMVPKLIKKNKTIFYVLVFLYLIITMFPLWGVFVC